MTSSTSPSTTPHSTERALPAAARYAQWTGLVLAGLMILAAVDFFAMQAGYPTGEAAIRRFGGVLELVLDGVVCLLAAGLLTAGSVLISRGESRGRQAMMVGAAIQMILVLLWLGRIQELPAVLLSIVPVLLGIVVLALLNARSVLSWFVAGYRPEHVSVAARVSFSWNSLARPQQWGLCSIIVVILIVLPLLNPTMPIIGSVSTSPGYDFGIALFDCARYALIAIGLNVVVGQAGLLDLGYVGFFAVGAYVAALFTSSDSTVQVFTDPHSNWAWLICVPLAMGITMIFGLILGVPTLRLRGDYLAIVTLGFGEIVRLVADNVPQLRGNSGFQAISGPSGSTGKDVLFPQTTHGEPFFYLTVGIIIVVLLFVGNLERSRVGRAWVAMRDDEDAAEIMGVPTFRFKLWAFVMGAAIGGISGALYAGQVGFVNNQRFDPVTSILFLSAVVLGGAGNKVGVMVGAFLIAYIPDRFTGIAEYKYLIFGIALIALMIFRPQGLLGARQRLLTFGRATYQRITGGPERLDTGTGAFSTDVEKSSIASSS